MWNYNILLRCCGKKCSQKKFFCSCGTLIWLRVGVYYLRSHKYGIIYTGFHASVFSLIMVFVWWKMTGQSEYFLNCLWYVDMGEGGCLSDGFDDSTVLSSVIFISQDLRWLLLNIFPFGVE